MIAVDPIAVLQGVIVVLIGAGVRGIFQINRRLNEMNGRIGKIEGWQMQHQLLDEKEFEAVRREIDKIKC